MDTLTRWIFRALGVTLLAWLTGCGGGGTSAPPVVASVEIRATGLLLQQAGQSAQLSAVAKDAAGNALDVPIAWRSGKPGAVGIDANGTVTAASANGSSQITASAQGVDSAPLLVVVTRPAAGAVLVSDAQVDGEPVESDPDAAPGFANTYRVALLGVAAPAVGTPLVGTGSKPVAGRVVAVASPAAGQTTVNLKAVLDPVTFLSLYNVDRIEWVHQVGGTQTTIATQPASSGQTEFNHALSATSAGAAGDYYAFVITGLPGLPLELGKVSLTETPVQACPTYEVDVGGRIGNSPSRVFHVGAQAGFSSPGAYGGATLGGSLNLVLTSGYAGTATAKGDVTFLVEADAPGPIDTIWLWSGRSNVHAGGSCRATLSLGGVTRSVTAPTSLIPTGRDEQVLEIPVTVRHDDVLQARLDAICSSPGLLAGPPEVLVNANIGMSLNTPGNPGVRFRPVMCIP